MTESIDGAHAEVLYPSVLFSIYQLKDVAIKAATMANYNDWLLNYTSQTPGRLFPLGLVQLDDSAAIISAIELAASYGGTSNESHRLRNLGRPRPLRGGARPGAADHPATHH